MLEHSQPARPRSTASEILKGIDLDGPRRRSARHHGPERLGQEHARAGAGGPRGLRGHRRARSTYLGQDLLALAPEERARAGVFLAFQYPVEIPGREQRLPAARPRSTRVRRQRGEPELDAFEFLTLVRDKMKLLRDGRELPRVAASTKASPAARRSATRSCRWRCSSRSSRSSTRPTRASTSTRCGSWPKASTACAARTARSCWSRTTSACSTTSCPTSCMCWPAAASSAAGGKELALELEKRGYDWVRQEAAGRMSAVLASEAAGVLTAPLRVPPARSRARPRRLRAQAFARFAELGFPAARDEAWKYTEPAASRVAPLPGGAALADASTGAERRRARRRSRVVLRERRRAPS